MLDFNHFQVLTFDCYGTLIDWESGILSVLSPLLEGYGLRVSDSEILEKYAKFESAAESFGEGVLAVLLTGMSGDGSAGLKRIKECGGYTLAQDPLTAKGRVVPKVGIESPAFDEARGRGPS